MKKDTTLDALMEDIKHALRDKERAERARVHAEQKKAKAHKAYTLLMDTFRAGEYTLS